MNNEKFMRSYVVISIFAAIYFLIAILLYQTNYTNEIYVEVETTLFLVTMTAVYGTVEIFNLPIVSFTLVFVINLLVVLFVTRRLETDKQPLKEVAIFNLLFSFLLIAGQILFVFMIPDRINGIPRDLVVFTEFPYTSEILIRAFNITYAVAFMYLIYNLLVLVQTREPLEETESVEEEENILAEFLKD